MAGDWPSYDETASTPTPPALHCWNLAADANNNQKSWLNQSNRKATLWNWINCTNGAEYFYLNVRRGITCSHIIGYFGNWCNDLRVTSISAGPAT